MSDVSVPGASAPSSAPGTSSVPADVQALGAESSESLESQEVEGSESSEEGSESTEQQAQEAKAKEKEAKEAKKSLRKKIPLKVNGKQQEVELDLENDEEIAKYLQKAMAADEKFREASSIRKQMETFVEMLKNDPLSILTHPELGIDAKQLAESIINKEIEEMQKSPEQKEKERIQKELEDYRKQLESEKEARRQAEMARLEEQAFMELDRDITQALDSFKDLPKSPYVVRRIADALIDATQLGYTDVKVGDVLPFVKEQIHAELNEMFNVMPEEVIEALMGSNLNRVRQKRIAKAKKAPTTASQVQATSNAQDAKQKAQQPEKKITMKEFFKPF
jgi:hypothetical protein